MNRQDELLDNLAKVQSVIPANVKLIVVTKTYPVSDIEILYNAGVRDFGENRDQEGAIKAPQIPSDANWHFQGQIQSNKIPSLIEWADYIHSLDDLDHAKKFNKRLAFPMKFFIQVSLDNQVGRGGISPEQLPDFIDEIERLPMINPVGLMAVAPVDAVQEEAFAKLEGIKAEITRQYPYIEYLSAGMSNDFKVAIRHGATHIRVGSSILGSRA